MFGITHYIEPVELPSGNHKLSHTTTDNTGGPGGVIATISNTPTRVINIVRIPHCIVADTEDQQYYTLRAFFLLTSSHPVSGAIAHWKTMSPEKQQKVRFRCVQDSSGYDRWSCNINHTGWTLIDSRGYVNHHLPKGMLSTKTGIERRKEQYLKSGYIGHFTSYGEVVHFTPRAAGEYVASQESGGIGFATFRKEDVLDFLDDLVPLLGIVYTSSTDVQGDIVGGCIGKEVMLYFGHTARFIDERGVRINSRAPYDVIGCGLLLCDLS